MSVKELERLARTYLRGVGDESKEWKEARPKAFHLRRRLTDAEQLVVGCAIDMRGTEEGAKRFDDMRHVLPEPAIGIALAEIAGIEA